MTTVDQITVKENGIVLYREVTKTVDGERESHSYHRASLVPGDSLTGVPDEVAAICLAAWTPEIISAFNAGKL